MTGQEIKDYLEFSYDDWINTVTRPGERLLKIEPRDDPRTGQRRWSFPARTYNFDSAAGINYTVDVTKPAGERVAITSLASGAPFDPAARYRVAMTSYRASGGGGLLPRGAGVNTDDEPECIVGKYPEVRTLIYDYIKEAGTVDPASVSDPALVGRWSFVPEKLAAPALEADMKLLFGK